MNAGDFENEQHLSADADAETDPRSRTEIVSDLWENTQRLVNQELQLLRADLDQRTRLLKRDLVEFSAAGAVGVAGALALLSALILLLARRLEPWLAATIVGVVMLAAGFLMFRHGRKKLAQCDLVPRQTVRSAETTAHTIKEALR